MVVNENKMAFCEKWKQMADRNGTPLAERRARELDLEESSLRAEKRND